MIRCAPILIAKIGQTGWIVRVCFPALVLALIASVMTLSDGTVRAADAVGAPAPAAANSRDYRRVYVPVDHIEAWPQDGKKYLPIEVREFDSLINAANQSSSLAANRATIDVAEYFGSLDDDGRFHGRGQWNISLHGKQDAFLGFTQLSLAIHEPRWQSAVQELVRLGFWGAEGSRP